MNNPNQKRKANKWLALTSIPIQMGAIVFLFAWGGKWLDAKYPNEHDIYVKVLTIVGVGLAFYNLNRQLREINKMDDQK